LKATPTVSAVSDDEDAVVWSAIAPCLLSSAAEATRLDATEVVSSLRDLSVAAAAATRLELAAVVVIAVTPLLLSSALAATRLEETALEIR
jgi:hypothetical protein